MATAAPIQIPTTAPVSRSINGRLRLTYPTRGYAVSRNPFAIWAILPLVTTSFLAVAFAEFFGDYRVTINWLGNTSVTSITAIAFAIVALGLLLIPAVVLKGSLNLTHDGSRSSVARITSPPGGTRSPASSIAATPGSA